MSSYVCRYIYVCVLKCNSVYVYACGSPRLASVAFLMSLQPTLLSNVSLLNSELCSASLASQLDAKPVSVFV